MLMYQHVKYVLKFLISYLFLHIVQALLSFNVCYKFLYTFDIILFFFCCKFAILSSNIRFSSHILLKVITFQFIMCPFLQAVLGTRRVPKIGLSDGEQCERLWSYLRCFSAITKEMTKSHRCDVLTSALIHYGKKSSGKLCEFLKSYLF